MDLYGRTKIETNVPEITSANVSEVLSTVKGIHEANVTQIEYLYKYYKGNQDIQGRQKDIRPEIMNVITENRAYEIVNFKVGYLVGNEVQYVSDTTEDISEKINQLNAYMKYNSKATKDTELVEWQMISGTAYMLALPSEDEECPVRFTVVDPRRAFVVYSTSVFGEALAGVYLSTDEEGKTVYTVYTPTNIFSVIDDEVKTEVNPLGLIPLIEYPANSSRLGAFELVISLLNALNDIDSNRLDSVEQFVQSLLVLYNAELPDNTTANTIRQAGMVLLKNVNGANADVKVISEELNQTQTQTLKQDLYEAVLTICSMPSRNTNDSGSNGITIVYRDGWSAAETAAQVTESMYKESDKQFRKVVFAILRNLSSLDLKVSDVEAHFTRRNYDNIATKSQVLLAMLGNDKVHPLYAYTACGLFSDPEEAYTAGMEWYENHQAQESEEGDDNNEYVKVKPYSRRQPGI